MQSNFKYFTSEAVLPGHPDKIADQISDLVLDEYLKIDLDCRTAIETLITHKSIFLAGEVSGLQISNVKIEEKIRHFLSSLGYQRCLLDWESIEIINQLHTQSEEIAQSVCNLGGAGDQGIMFGYATDETESFMPAAIYWANKILLNIKNNTQLGPDGKSQVTVEYDVKNTPVKIDNVVVSVQHSCDISQSKVSELIYDQIDCALPKGWMPDKSKIFINPAGRFTKGGPASDSGLTGRKIVADTYGGAIPNGGGAFSGKDATKVDRSAAYMARYVAKNIVASGLAKRCSVQLCYAIGINHELLFQINTHGSSIICEEEIRKYIVKNLSFCPVDIIKILDLKKPIYLPTATQGHFGKSYKKKSGLFTWENLDLADKLSLHFATKAKNLSAKQLQTAK